MVLTQESWKGTDPTRKTGREKFEKRRTEGIEEVGGKGSFERQGDDGGGFPRSGKRPDQERTKDGGSIATWGQKEHLSTFQEKPLQGKGGAIKNLECVKKR